jgi:uncharacterized Zn-binding protein involved in type VI secretion
MNDKSKGSIVPLAARTTDTVNTVHNAIGDDDTTDSIQCDKEPTDTTADECSSDVFVEGLGAVREGDKVTAHTYPSNGCLTHAPGLVTFSGTVKINGKGAGRKGDTYGCTAKITGSAAKTSFGD